MRMDAIAIGFLVWFRDFERFAHLLLALAIPSAITVHVFIYKSLNDSDFNFAF